MHYGITILLLYCIEFLLHISNNTTTHTTIVLLILIFLYIYTYIYLLIFLYIYTCVSIYIQGIFESMRESDPYRLVTLLDLST